jgi:hypothetical protein
MVWICSGMSPSGSREESVFVRTGRAISQPELLGEGYGPVVTSRVSVRT